MYIYIYREREGEREGEREREREANNRTRVYVCMCVYYIWSKRHHTKINPPQSLIKVPAARSVARFVTIGQIRQ
jgi:hypothetical protein